MNKMQMAHEYAMLHMSNPQYKDVDDLEMVQWAFDYADAMQAEADKRITEVRIDGVSEEHADALRKACVKEWQPDWSVAPQGYSWFAIDKDGSCGFYMKKPFPSDKFEAWFKDESDFSDFIRINQSFNYQGNWQDSLRKRPK